MFHIASLKDFLNRWSSFMSKLISNTEWICQSEEIVSFSHLNPLLFIRIYHNLTIKQDLGFIPFRSTWWNTSRGASSRSTSSRRATPGSRASWSSTSRGTMTWCRSSRANTSKLDLALQIIAILVKTRSQIIKLWRHEWFHWISLLLKGIVYRRNVWTNILIVRSLDSLLIQHFFDASFNSFMHFRINSIVS